MPRGDRTGPWGMGPMTGRAAGYCAGYGAPGYANPYQGRFGGFGGRGAGRGFAPWGGGRGRAWGGGRGRGFGYGAGFQGAWGAPYVPWGDPNAAPGLAVPYPQAPYDAGAAPEQELEFLRSHSQSLANEMESVKARIEELEAGKTK